MRLNRKWLYLGGLVTILTLLLTLTWVLPAGAVGTLDGGSVSVDKDFVSPAVQSGGDSTTGLEARTVEVTLSNSDLTSTEEVARGADLGPVTILIGSPGVSATERGSFRVQLNQAPIAGTTGSPIATATIPQDVDGDDVDDASNTTMEASLAILPIVGDVTVHTSTSKTVRDKLGTPRVINPANGLIEFPLLGSLIDEETIVLSYSTSKSETALVNVRGEDDFDLLLVESDAQGDYSETFVVNEPDNVVMSNASVVHEQHNIPTGLRGYIEIDNERIDTFYYNSTTNTAAHNASTGVLSGAEAYRTALTTIATGQTERGIPSGETFYARVKNPPIRDVTDGANLTDSPDPDITVESVTGITAVTVIDADQGVLRFQTNALFTGFSGGDIEVDYTGSDSFEIIVEQDPMVLGGLNISTDDIFINEAAPPAALDTSVDGSTEVPADSLFIVLPRTDADAGAPMASEFFRIISIDDDGNNCDVCKVRIGVVTSPDDGDDPEALPARYSVLGISYRGSETVDIPDNRDVGSHNVETDDDTTNGDDMYEFSRVLRYPPHDTDAEMDGVQPDIAFIASSHDGIDVDAPDITVASVNGRRVTFRLNLEGLDRTTDADNTRATDGDTFDITYSRQVGALPRNALNPGAPLRPVAAVADGSRVRVASSNDSATVDAETQGPSFSNAMPTHKSGSGSNSEVLSIDVTDALAGVDKDSIKLMVRAGSLSLNTVIDSDLTITDIDGGYRASIALNEVRNAGTGAKLNVSTSQETQINWYAVASDEAGNQGTSDSNTAKRDRSGQDGNENQNAANPAEYDDCQRRSAGSDDCYSFSVDGVSPTMQRAYTGDSYNAIETRVDGDRRVGRDNYLRGSGSNTSIRVVFNEAIDGSSVSADDFTVDGSAPDSAVVYSSGSTDGSDGPDDQNDGIRRSVFLEVGAMAPDATPEVVLTGTVTDLAGNPVSSGTKTAIDGLAPGATLSVDKTIDQKTVTVTVTTDEAVRLQSPDLLLWVSDAIDTGYDDDLDESDTFTVEPEIVGGSTDRTINPLVIKGPDGDLAYTGDLAVAANWNLRLAKAPILDGEGTTSGIDHNDIKVVVFREDSPTSAETNVVINRPTGMDAETVRNAKTGEITLRILGKQEAVEADDSEDPPVEARAEVLALSNGDKIVVTYRGTDPDPANQFPTVPDNVRGVPVTGSPNTWTYKLDITRDDRFAATAEMEDSNLNRGSGGMGDPTASGAVVFEIDGELAGDSDTDASSVPADDPTASSPVGMRDPFFIELNWEKEAGEYPGDSHTGVTLTKAELDGVDVMDNAVAQDSNSWRIRVGGLSLGEHTLAYNGMDDAGNTNTRDRTLTFTVKESPTWDLKLTAGMNLISLPSNPSNGDVNEVFGGASQIDLIFTFEGAQSLVAVRNPGTGEFAGTLTSIDARHAYWVSVSNATTVEIDIPPTSQLTVLPNIAVKGGEWNLVPVLSLGAVDDGTAGRGAKPGTKIDADAYLGSFQTAFGWDSGRWQRVDPDATTGTGSENRLGNDVDDPEEDGDDPLRVGKGYWVLYTDDAFIVPR